MTRRDEVRRKALDSLKEFEVLMLDGHFDYGNGYHGRVYLNPHRIFRQPSLIWRLAQDLLDTVGTVVWLEHEAQMDAVTAVSGSGPACRCLRRSSAPIIC